MPEVLELFEYWDSYPPEHELLRIAIDVYTTWEPKKNLSEAEVIAEHRRSLQQRWKAGAMNVEQLFHATGGGRMVARGGSDHPYSNAQMPQISHPDIPGLNLALTGPIN